MAVGMLTLIAGIAAGGPASSANAGPASAPAAVGHVTGPR